MFWEKLNRFAKISKYKSLSEAARIENFSQSTWSRDITDLESILGVTLVIRNYKGIKLTEKGKNLSEIVINFKTKLKHFKSTS
jgi:DNA-binding transcriptional LysR family regulator